MFESAELGHKVDKELYKRELPALREALLTAQAELLEQRSCSVVIIVGGVDGAGKGETVNVINEWMDPRHIATHAFAAPSDEERERPPFFRFWNALPPKGKIGVFFGSWYTDPILRRAYGKIDSAELDRRSDEIVRLERMLSDDGVLVIKLWMHLGKAQQKKRLKQLERDRKSRWRVGPDDWKHFALYDTFAKVSAACLRRTSTAEAPWLVVEGMDPRYRSLTVGNALLAALRARLAEQRAPATPAAPASVHSIDGRTVLSDVEQPPPLEEAEYEERLEALQARLARLSRKRRFHSGSVLAVFEGMDAAGKGGAIRTITGALDARVYRVVPFAAPTDEERARPYLWRFWRQLPRHGRLALYDRSWYGRVLVERVEGFCSEAEWMRGYQEINDFEDQLTRAGVLLTKFWLHVSPDEQLRRFEERKATAYKLYKITDEDWRNRGKLPAYMVAAADMIDRTSTELAPWTIVPADDKRRARLQVLETLVDRLRDG